MKTTRYHLTLVRMAVINKSANNKCWRRYVEKETLLHCWWECEVVQHTMEVPQKTKYRTTIWSSIYPDKAFIPKDTHMPVSIAALFTTAKTWKWPKCPLTDEWIKMWYLYTMEYYSAMKRKKIMPFATTWMELEILFFFFFRALPEACGGSQARGRIGAVAACLRQSYSKMGSKPHLQPTPQLTAMPNL